ncbi:chemotaxis protein CheW [Bdellovibrionota bacterium FG-2]
MGEFKINISEAKEFFDDVGPDVINMEGTLANWNNEDAAANTIDLVFRFFHNIKGASGMFGLTQIQELFHVGEDLLGVLRDQKRKPALEVIELLIAVLDAFKSITNAVREAGAEPKSKPYSLLGKLAEAKEQAQSQAAANAASPQGGARTLEKAEDTKAAPNNSRNNSDDQIRISNEKAMELMEIVSNFIQLQNRLAASLGEGSESFKLKNDVSRFSGQLQSFVLSIRLNPIQPILSGLQRVAMEAAKATGKKVILKVTGGETQLDRRVIDMLREPLVHLLRNSIDHGLEDPEVRKTNNKKPEGLVTVDAAHQSGQIIITIEDDGGGINPEVVKANAVRKGLLTQAQADVMMAKDAINLIFAPGFSTKEAATSISGRGVGMDVVKSAVESIGGNVELLSEVGRGTKVVLVLPLTLAIVKSLAFAVGRNLYAVPQINVEEVVTEAALLASGEIQTLGDSRCVLLRRRNVVSVVDLVQILGKEHNKSNGRDHIFIIVRNKGKQFALRVEKVIGTRDFISQPVPDLFSAIGLVTGVNQLNSGEYIGLLDLNILSDLVADSTGMVFAQDSNQALSSDVYRSRQKMAFFKSGKLFAIPVQEIRQVLRVSHAQLDKLVDKAIVTLGEKVVPVIRLPHHFAERDFEPKSSYELLVVERDHAQAALVCEEFYGIHYLPTEFQHLTKTRGVLGSVVHEEKTFFVLNTRTLFEMEFVDQFQDSSETLSAFNVLVVEDDRFCAISLMDFLRSNHCNPILCNDGAEAKVELEKSLTNGTTMHYVVTDYEMPNCNGIELLSWIRKNSQLCNLSVSLCSAVGNELVRRSAENLGVDTFCGKMDHDELLQWIDRRKEQLEIGVSQIQAPKKINAAELARSDKRVLTFEIGDGIYGMEISCLKEISNPSVATEIAGLDSYANKLVGFRGAPIPVIDLRMLCSDGGVTGCEQIVAQFGGQLCAMWVHKIVDVERVQAMNRSTTVAKLDSSKAINRLISEVLWSGTRAVGVMSISKMELMLRVFKRHVRPTVTVEEPAVSEQAA